MHIQAQHMGLACKLLMAARQGPMLVPRKLLVAFAARALVEISMRLYLCVSC